MGNRFLIFNGINAATGGYLLPEMSYQEVLDVVAKRPIHVSRGVNPDVDVGDLASSGWGVIFPRGADPEIREALAPLLELRRSQAARIHEHRYQEYVDERGYRSTVEGGPGGSAETMEEFLIRHDVEFGPADPDQMPYYLLIVGGPEIIPWEFQYRLDVQYAVGRLDLATPEDYARYAESVVAAETGGMLRNRGMTFFGVRNPDDQATALSSKYLIEPLLEKLNPPDRSTTQENSWEIRAHTGDQATKEQLGRLMGGVETPALVFTASHGMGFCNGHPLQLSDQGAVLCQDWPGPREWRDAIPPEHYFAAADVDDRADVHGLISMHFACYGAGTPKLDDFAHRTATQPEAVAPRAFVARLPRRLLSHPRGGALAAVGHVSRAWGYSFLGSKLKSQVKAFRSCIELLQKGYPVGAAMETFNQRYAELAIELSKTLQEKLLAGPVDPQRFRAIWTANNDARSYVVFGDPAVRLAVGPPSTGRSQTGSRPESEAVGPRSDR